MKYNRLATDTNWQASLALTAFLVIFPGAFIYHSLLGLGFINPFLGGYFTNIILAFSLPLFLAYISQTIRNGGFIPKIDFFFLLFISYFSCVIFLNYINSSNYLIVRSHLISVLQFVVIFAVFKMIDVNKSTTKNYTFISFLLMSFIVFYNSSDGLFNLKKIHSGQNTEMIATYQSFSMVYMLNLFILIVLIKNGFYRFFLYIISIFVLYLNGSRSEFVAIVVVAPVVEFYYSRYKLFLSFAFLSICSFFVLGFNLIVKIIPNNRILLLFSPSTDASVLERKRLASLAYETIAQNPILGDYASYQEGSYIHNIFSAWVDLGLFGFIFLLFLLIIPFLRLLFAGLVRKEKSDALLLAGCLTGITILLLFVAKSFTYQLIPAALGAYSGYCCGKFKSVSIKSGGEVATSVR